MRNIKFLVLILTIILLRATSNNFLEIRSYIQISTVNSLNSFKILAIQEYPVGK